MSGSLGTGALSIEQKPRSGRVNTRNMPLDYSAIVFERRGPRLKVLSESEARQELREAGIGAQGILRRIGPEIEKQKAAVLVRAVQPLEGFVVVAKAAKTPASDMGSMVPGV